MLVKSCQSCPFTGLVCARLRSFALKKNCAKCFSASPSPFNKSCPSCRRSAAADQSCPFIRVHLRLCLFVAPWASLWGGGEHTKSLPVLGARSLPDVAGGSVSASFRLLQPQTAHHKTSRCSLGGAKSALRNPKSEIAAAQAPGPKPQAPLHSALRLPTSRFRPNPRT
jgi:hypothetical protein